MSNSTLYICIHQQKSNYRPGRAFPHHFPGCAPFHQFADAQPDDGATFRIAVDFLATNPLIKVMEIVLFAGLLSTLCWAS
jgi:hypothetical protein